MDYYQKILPNSDFYRLNRQVIINRKCIKYFKNIEYRKLKVIYGIDKMDRVAIISQKKVSNFKNWHQKI